MSITNPATSSAQATPNAPAAPGALSAPAAPSALSAVAAQLTLEVAPHQDPEQALAQVLAQKPKQAFDPAVMAWVKQLSETLRHDPRCRSYPDLLALGFWLRAGNLDRLAQSYQDHSIRLGRGLAFHFAPNNVTTLFAYSLILSLLAGNSNVVRLGQKSTPEQQVLIAVLQGLAAQHQECAQRILIVRYGHDDEVNRFLCAHCAVRIIWGGDRTVEHLRQLPMPAGSCELTFANKFSWALIDAQHYLEQSRDSAAPQAIAQSFITDAFTFGQQGCSSPRLILWLGAQDTVQQAKAQFWSSIDQALISRPFALSPAQISERFLAASSPFWPHVITAQSSKRSRKLSCKPSRKLSRRLSSRPQATVPPTYALPLKVGMSSSVQNTKAMACFMSLR